MILPFCAAFMTSSNGRLIPHEISLQNVRNKNTGCQIPERPESAAAYHNDDECLLRG